MPTSGTVRRDVLVFGVTGPKPTSTRCRRAAYLERSPVQVDVLPPQPQQLAAPQPQVERQDVTRVEPSSSAATQSFRAWSATDPAVHLVLRAETWTSLATFRCISSSRTAAWRRCAGQRGPAAPAGPKEPVRSTRPTAQHLRSSRLVCSSDPCRQHRHVFRAASGTAARPRRSAVQLLASQQRDEVHPDNDARTPDASSASWRAHHMLEPVEQEPLDRPPRRLRRNALIRTGLRARDELSSSPPASLLPIESGRRRLVPLSHQHIRPLRPTDRPCVGTPKPLPVCPTPTGLP